MRLGRAAERAAALLRRPRETASADAAPSGAVDWAELAAREQDPQVVTVLVSARPNWEATSSTLNRLSETSPDGLDVLVVASGSSASELVPAEALASEHPGVRVLYLPTRVVKPAALTLALSEVHGSTVVVLSGDCEPEPGWLEPLVAALQDSRNVVAGSLVLNKTRTLSSAGYAFPPTGGLPYRMLAGFPSEDADGLLGVPLTAVDGRALAMRFADLVALRGFDPGLGNGLADVDLCLRAQADGRQVVLAPGSRVVRTRGRPLPAPGGSAADRDAFLDRWPKPPAGADLWAETPFRVLGFEPAPADEVAEPRAVVPLLARRLESVTESQILRWAIKNPALADHTTHLWGDTNYARHLAEALRRLGQEVVVDLRPEFQRATGDLDDVVLVLRGLTRHQPSPGQINLLWVISHPEKVTREELAAYDQVFAAGPAWVERMSREWDIPIRALMQATDPRLFNPDRAQPDSGARVLFVGNARETPRPVVMDAVASGVPVDVYGLGWSDWIPADLIRGTELSNADLGAAYRAASVVLADHWDGARREGFVSNRLFDSVAAGARVISDPIEGLEELFGRCVQASAGPDDMKRLLTAPDYDAVFGDDEERLHIADRVRSEHSFDKRAEELLEVALTHRHRISRD